MPVRAFPCFLVLLLLTGCYEDAVEVGTEAVLSHSHSDLDARLAALEAEAAQAATERAALQASVGLLRDDLEGAVERIAALETSVGDLVTTVGSLETGGGTLAADLDRLAAELGGTPGAAPADGLVDSRLDAAQLERSSLDLRVFDLEGQAQDATTGFFALDGRLSAVEPIPLAVAALEGRVASLDGGSTYLPPSGFTSLADVVDSNTAVAELALSEADDALSELTGAGTLANSRVDLLETEVGDAANAFADSRIDLLDLALDDGSGGLVDALIDADVTYTIDSAGGADFVDLNEALASLEGTAIASTATVMLEVQAGNHPHAEPILVNHPDGGRIQIVGPSTNPADAVLTFFETDGIVVRRGSALGLLDGLTLQQTGAFLQTRGINIRESSSASLGPDVVVEGFRVGAEAMGGSWMQAPGVQFVDNYQGVLVTNTSAASLVGAQIGSDGSATNSLDGLQCNAGSYVDLINGEVEGYSRWGVFAGRGAVVEAWGADFGTVALGGTGQANGTDRKQSTETGDIRWIAY